MMYGMPDEVYYNDMADMMLEGFICMRCKNILRLQTGQPTRCKKCKRKEKNESARTKVVG